jgi:hypothetical protein
VLQLAEDVLDELQRQVLGPRHELALQRPLTLVGREHQNRPDGVVGFRGQLHRAAFSHERP